jgi:hypothetical protein
VAVPLTKEEAFIEEGLDASNRFRILVCDYARFDKPEAPTQLQTPTIRPELHPDADAYAGDIRSKRLITCAESNVTRRKMGFKPKVFKVEDTKGNPFVAKFNNTTPFADSDEMKAIFAEVTKVDDSFRKINELFKRVHGSEYHPVQAIAALSQIEQLIATLNELRVYDSIVIPAAGSLPLLHRHRQHDVCSPCKW